MNHGDSTTWRRTTLALAWATSLVLVSVLGTRAAPPPPSSRTQLTFQCKITTGPQPASGQFPMIFHVFDSPSGGAPLWTEAHDGSVLPQPIVFQGILSVVLGQVVPLDASVFDPVGTGDRYVAIVIGGSEVARVKLTATAYSVVASVANAVWDPATGTSLDVSSLDTRYVQTSGAGGGVLRSINGLPPSAQGNFSISASPSGRVVVTSTANGIELDAVGGSAGGLDQVTADARYVNAAGDVVTGDLGVAGGLSAHILRTSVIQFDPLNNGRIETESGHFDFRRSGGVGGPNASFDLNSSQSNFRFSGKMRVTDVLAADGGLVVPSGKTKAFYHDLGDGRAIYYCALEGPGCDNFIRGEGQLVNGRAVIDLPEHFATVTEGDLTAHLTPLGPTPGLYVAGVSDHQLEVREGPAGSGDVRFHYLVLGRRVGHADEQVIRPAPGSAPTESGH